MPKKRCINEKVACYMHRKKVENQGYFEDINHNKLSRYRDYECDCGDIHRFDIYSNIWLC